MEKINQGMLFLILAGWTCLVQADTAAAPMSATAPSATVTPSATTPATTKPAAATTAAATPDKTTSSSAAAAPASTDTVKPSATTTITTTPAATTTSTTTPVATTTSTTTPAGTTTSTTTPAASTPATSTTNTTTTATDASKCPCDFNQDDFKKFAASMKHGGFICTAQNTRVVGMEDNKPFLSIAVELSAVDKDKRDAATSANDKDALAAATTSWGMVYTSLDNVDPKFKVRICSKNLVGDRQTGFQAATQLDNFTQYQACLKDILSVAAAMNIPCGM